MKWWYRLKILHKDNVSNLRKTMMRLHKLMMWWKMISRYECPKWGQTFYVHKASGITYSACSALLVLAVFTSGCAVADGNINSLLQKRAVTKSLFDVTIPRSDSPEAIDKELDARYERIKKETDALFKEEQGRLVLKHKYGTTILPENPQRVVVIRLEDPMIALGAPMVGAYNTESFYLHEELISQGVQTISINEATKAINLEQVQALKPDLILLRDSFDRNTFNALSKIAPVGALNLQKSEVTLLALGRILHREEQAEARLKTYYEHVKDSRIAIKAVIGDAPVAFLRILKKEVRIYPYDSNDINRFMYELLNIKPDPLAITQNGADSTAISLEMLPELQADYLIVSSGYGPSSAGNTEAAEKRYEELRTDPLWQVIPAVREQHILNVNPLVWNAHGIIAKERAMDDLVKYFSK
ncbi:ABC transporter substrate-binding protein [uncultured Veillonella sp.]|uniref:ABC transporter substrate-binding protein n=1 Tax=uncultured Veillonella sp. TaxID=159268 RepID=UPI002623F752|nr:ABC transporter substrate-binding protein [uncultured Veillonella sp.]